MEATNRRDFEDEADDMIMLYIAEGDSKQKEVAAQVFLGRYSQYLHRLATSWCRYRYHPDNTARDMVCLTLAKVITEKAGMYDESKGSVKTWLGRILKNVIADEYRKLRDKSPTIVHFDDLDESTEAPPVIDEEEVDVKNVNRVLLEEALSTLSEIERSVLIDYWDLKGMDNLEGRLSAGETRVIAEQYGLTLPNLRQKANRALKKVKKHIEDHQ